MHAATQVLADLAWKLHVATQVPAQLVGLAAACEQRRGVGWCGPGSGPAVASSNGLVGWPGKGLAGWPGKGPAVARWRPGKGLAGGLVDSLGQDPAEGRRLLVLI